MLDLNLFDKLEGWLTLGDVLPTVTWQRLFTGDERYEVKVTWKFRNQPVGQASFFIEPIFETDDFRLYWNSLSFVEEWQQKGLYTEIVKQLPSNIAEYGVIETTAIPWNADAERRLASQGFKWVGKDFVLRH